MTFGTSLNSKLPYDDKEPVSSDPYCAIASSSWNPERKYGVGSEWHCLWFLQGIMTIFLTLL